MQPNKNWELFKALDYTAEVDNNKKNELKAIFNEIDDYYKSLSDFKDKPKYISNYDLYQFKELHKLLLEKFNEPEYELLPDFDKEITTINQFKSNFNSLENDIQKMIELNNYDFDVNYYIEQIDELLGCDCSSVLKEFGFDTNLKNK
jgi:hypothetical protein